MKTITVTVSQETVEKLSRWMESLHLTGNLTKDDPARVFAGVILHALVHDKKTITLAWEDIAE